MECLFTINTVTLYIYSIGHLYNKIEINYIRMYVLFFIMTIRIEQSATAKYWVKYNPNGHDKAYEYNTKKFVGYWIPFLNEVCYWVDELHPHIEEPDLILYPAE